MGAPGPIPRVRWHLQGATALLSIAMIAVAATALWFGWRLAATHAPLVEAAVRVRLEASEAHLWFEEIISGDSDEQIETVWSCLDRARGLTCAMREGGVVDGRHLIALESHDLRERIGRVEAGIDRFQRLAEVRYRSAEGAEAGSASDRQFDQVFREVLHATEDVEDSVHETIAREQSHFLLLEISLLAGLALLTGATLVVIHRFERRRARDLAALVAGEQALRASEQRFELLFRQAPLSYHALDHAGRILDVNETWCATLGYARERVIGRPFREFVVAPTSHAGDADTRDTDDEGDQSMRLGDSLPLPGDVELRARDGSIIITEMTSGVALDAAGEPCQAHCIFTDVTDRRQFEAHLRQSQKLESLGVMAGGIAHDFNNLLTGILGGAELTLRGLPPHSPLRTHLDIVRDSALHAAELTRQMLVYAGKGRPAPRTLSVAAVVQELEPLLRTMSPPKTTLEVKRASDLPPVEADESQLRQVILNLVQNAGESYEGDRGTVTLALAVEDHPGGGEAEQLFGPPAAPGSYLALKVTDHGCGMEEHESERIFEPFYTTKFQGRGLGLAAVLGVVRSHGGNIQVDSTPGEGTSIRVLLPVSQRHPAEIPRSRDDAPAEQQPGVILVVDDEAQVRQVAQGMLESLGLEVVAVSSAREALLLLAEDGTAPGAAERFDLVLLDVTMPDIDGVEVLERIHALPCAAPVVLCSGHSEEETQRRAAGTHPAAYLHKPFRFSALAEVIQRCRRSRIAPPR